MTPEDRLKVANATFKMIDVSPRDLALRDRAESGALDTDRFTGRTRRQVLVTSVLPYSTAMIGADYK